MFRGMKSLVIRSVRLATVAAILLFCANSASQGQTSKAQASQPGVSLARRLILKDGTYQSVTKYEVHGERVRYFSAERGEWEEVPKSLVDWEATDSFEKGRQQGQLAPEALDLDKQLEAERKAEQARSPEVAPGLRLPDEGGIFLLDTFEHRPQLSELQQSGGDLDKNTKSNVLRAVINPLAGAKQNIQLPGLHSKIQSHANVPSLYINLDPNTDGNPSAGGIAHAANGDPAPAPTERFKIIRVEPKGGKRVAGAVKIAVTGTMKTDERFVPATAAVMTGGWLKLTPTEPLATGEYAVAEMLSKEGMNLYVWDFGVNPSAPENPFPWKPDPATADPRTDQPSESKKQDQQ